MQQFKIRCSAIGQIMTEPRSKLETLSETCKGYLETWVKERIYDRRKDFTSKYTNKGNSVEDEAIEYLGDVRGTMYVKNAQWHDNGYMTGTPDIITPNVVIDIKSSWDCFTFPLFDTVIDKKYWWQLQGYMALTGKKQAELVYVLMNTPDEIIEKEARSLNGWEDPSLEFYEEVADRMRYDNFGSEFRVKTFVIDADEDAHDAIKQRVIACREHINTNFNLTNQPK